MNTLTILTIVIDQRGIKKVWYFEDFDAHVVELRGPVCPDWANPNYGWR